MEYHPGGEDELMKAAGTDGTDLFDQVRTTSSLKGILKKKIYAYFLIILGHPSGNDLNHLRSKRRQ